LVVKPQRLNVLVKIARFAGAAAQSVDFPAREAVQVIELHRRQRRAKPDHFFRWLIQFAALVVRADDEHAHIAFRRRLHRVPGERIDEIPVQVHVIELARLDRADDHPRHGVRREPDEPHAAFLL